MSDDKSRVKRRRTIYSPSSDTDADQRVRRSSIWFDDGNIVIIAEDTHFKIYGGWLSSRFASIAFADMLSQTSPTDLLDGCRILRLSDSADDITHLLNALLDRRYFRDEGSQPFPIVKALLRLGKKYGIDHLWEDAKSRLQTDFPHRLEEWDEMAGWVAISGSLSVQIDAIGLAWETGLLSILPAAFYSCCYEKDYLEVAFTGSRRPDGSIARLSQEDQARFGKGRRELLRAQAKYSFSWLDPENLTNNPTGCVTVIGCRKVKDNLFRRLWSPVPDVWALEAWNVEWEVDLCSHCTTSAKKSFINGQKQIWDELPAIFELPPWAELMREP
ncbi:hypothetical protein JAAARDRAFT_131676 [Jaapia argillacea MUCL 33604]|uniref:BTB domain-containing protein n=1 Tax=Jaapia argillacea MUCL 33604 TaxID=933084 RepID=A0A067PP22_9AGAM|nr:hypothetical protein JAAARDRAFT_131676 [Jaapia argillacea MUCL 33604]